MFDVGFQELMLIFVVALVVLGPKRMQQLVTKVGRWVGKARGMARQFREQLETEVNLDDLDKCRNRGSALHARANRRARRFAGAGRKPRRHAREQQLSLRRHLSVRRAI